MIPVQSLDFFVEQKKSVTLSMEEKIEMHSFWGVQVLSNVLNRLVRP